MRTFLLALAGAVLFAFYDVVGYHVVTTRRGQGGPPPASSLAGYRVIQTLFQLVLAALLAEAVGWRCAVAFILVWWFGACDFLYYVLLLEPVPPSLTWVWWTPCGLVFLAIDSIRAGKITKRPIPGWLFVAQSATGVVLAFLVAREA